VKSSGCLENALAERDKDSQNNGGKLVIYVFLLL